MQVRYDNPPSLHIATFRAKKIMFFWFISDLISFMFIIFNHINILNANQT